MILKRANIVIFLVLSSYCYYYVVTHVTIVSTWVGDEDCGDRSLALPVLLPGDSSSITISSSDHQNQNKKQDFRTCMLEMEAMIRYTQPAYYLGAFPILSSILPRTRKYGSLRYVMNLKFYGERKRFYDKWADINLWKCKNEHNSTAQQKPVRFEGLDPHRHTLIVHCDGVLQVRHPERPMVQGYPIHQGCEMLEEDRSIEEDNHHHLALCTMVKGPNLRQEITEWVAYHSLLGIERFFIYVNDLFDDYLDFVLPNVTFLPFQHGVTKAFFFQQAMQNDCIHRTRHKVDWVGLNDIDEYFHFLGGEGKYSSLWDYLNHQKSTRNISAIQAPNMFWGSNNGTMDDKATTNLTLDKYCWRDPQPSGRREKVWLQPTKIQYMSIHTITLGDGPTTKADPIDLLNAHFKRPHKGVFERYEAEITYDESLRKAFVSNMTRWISENT